MSPAEVLLLCFCCDAPFIFLFSIEQLRRSLPRAKRRVALFEPLRGSFKNLSFNPRLKTRGLLIFYSFGVKTFSIISSIFYQSHLFRRTEGLHITSSHGILQCSNFFIIGFTSWHKFLRHIIFKTGFYNCFHDRRIK